MYDKDMTTTIEFLTQLKKDYEGIAGRWNGDESGLQEDRARHALEVIEKVDELIELLNEA